MTQTPEQACAALVDRMRTLQLATVGDGSEPHCGYTPFIFVDSLIYVFVSQLAAHTRDMLARPKVAVMLIDDEHNTSQLFARCRVSYQCDASVVGADAAVYDEILDAYQTRHGKMVGLLRQLPDFTLFRLTPVSGQFVMGFGKAYHLRGENLHEFLHTRTG